MYCKKCGAKLNEGALFCPKCGTSVNAEGDDTQLLSNVGNSIDSNTDYHESSLNRDSVADTGANSKSSASGALSADEIKAKQSRTTKILAGTAVAAVIAACLFVFIGNPAINLKKMTNKESEEAKLQQESAESVNDDDVISSAPAQEMITEQEKDSAEPSEEYISLLSEIPSDLFDKLKAQATDVILAYAASHWDNNVSVADTEYIGSYLLRKKDGIKANYENILYVAYAVKATIKTDSAKEKNATILFYTSFYDLKKNSEGVVETDIGNYQIPGNSFDITISNSGKKEWYSFVGYEDVDSMYKDLVQKSLDQYTCDGNIEYETVVSNDNGESLNEEFGIDSNTIEDYSANLNKDLFGFYDSGITDFNFRYPLNLYNNVTKNEEPFETEYGTNEVTYTFTGSGGSKLIFTLINRDDNRSIKEMSKYVYTRETNSLIDSADIVNSVSSDHGKVIVTGWEDTTKELIIYDMLKIEYDYVLQMKVYMPDFTDDNDKNEKSYVTECDYRYCGFSDSKYSARTYEEYLEAN